MTSTAHRRLMKDYRAMQEDSSFQGISAAPDDQDTLKWKGVIVGPQDTHWEGGIFTLSLQFTHEYPSKPPEVKFLTKIYHPNGLSVLKGHESFKIYADGSLCLDILQKNWSSAYTVGAILTSIQSLLPDPNPDSPANAEAAKLFVDDPMEYYKRVQESVEGSWTYR